LLPPASLSHINDAADLLAEAVAAQAKVIIVGDFDADGATSVAVAIRALKAFGLEQVSYLVPNRFEFGYGLTPEIVGMAAIEQPDIIITVDNGISSVDGVHAAQGLGITVLVTDHHLPGEELPTADVIVNPNLSGDKFASKNLAGVGVIFYVMLALRARLRALQWFSSQNREEPNMLQFLDIVALGTVADVVPLDHNNRVLVHQGLHRINQGHACAGINALLKVAKRSVGRIGASDLGFAVGPRLNAAGRLDDMSVGIECLLTDDVATAERLAEQLDALNHERRAVEKGMQEEALLAIENIQIDDASTPHIYILHDPSWHQGVIGLVASRIKEKTQRPVMALAPSDQSGEWKGSARSVQGIHIRDLLARFDALYPRVLKKYGGHAMAAGFSIDESKLESFSQNMQTVITEFAQGHDWTHRVLTDGELSELDFSIELAEELRQCSPWGQQFPEPSFDGVFSVDSVRVVGDTHIKLSLRPENSSHCVDGICFSYLEKHTEHPHDQVRLVYRLDVNEFRGARSLQLLITQVEQL
jgi:single-stranded-DNA-specific exonuclease